MSEFKAVQSLRYLVKSESATLTRRTITSGPATYTSGDDSTGEVMASGQQMTTRLYGRDIREYDEVDFETLLAKLTPEELEELNSDVDPDNSLLPPSERCREQTDKQPTGPFKREKLLHYLEDKAKNEKDWDERVPYEAGKKRGSVFKPKQVQQAYSEEEEEAVEIELDDEMGTALGTAGEEDLVDLAGILGMHSMLSQAQYYNAVKGKPQDELSGTTFTGLVKSTLPKVLPDEPPNDTDVEDCIGRLTANDASLTDINLNNMKTVSKERIVSLIEAAKRNNHLKSLSLANTAISDAEARGLIELLEENNDLSVLNVESNFLSPDLLARLLRATLKNQSLIEIHAENQRAVVLGNQIEMDIMQSIEANDTLLRVGISFQSMEARNRVSEAVERNYERLRLRRIEGAD